MTTQLNCDICVIGAGSGGLTVASGAAQMGANVILVEEGKMGGECLNYGCVPSKSILAAAKTAHTIKEADRFGITVSTPSVDFKKLHDYIQDVIKALAPNDSQERFEELGVKVIKGKAQFINPQEISVNELQIKARRFVIATGSSPTIPPIPGLNKINYLTNKTIFDLTEAPTHLIILGGGPIGCELAYAYRLLGVPVTLIQHSQILKKDEPEAAEIIRQELMGHGVALYEGTEIQSITENHEVIFTHQNELKNITGSHILVATGQTPNLDLNLDAANVKTMNHAIAVDKHLRTSNRRIFAIGDVTGRYQFTHVANYHAGIVIRNILFHLPAKINTQTIPWCTFTTPEVAHIGMTQAEAEAKTKNSIVLTSSFSQNDRATTDSEQTGFIKIITNKKGTILGVTIVGNNAGELISLWGLAMSQKLKINSIATLTMPYPSRSELSKTAAGNFYAPMLFSPRIKKLVKILMWFNW